MDSVSSKLLLIILLLILSNTGPVIASPFETVITLNIHCMDSRKKPLAGARVRLTSEGTIVFEGITNMSGWISISLPRGTYQLVVDWLNSTVFSSKIKLVEPSTLDIICSVYYLEIIVNTLYLFPVTQAKVTIERNGTLIFFYEGELQVPYKIYQLSGELVVRLPRGRYTVSVEMIGSERKEITLTSDETVVFIYVASIPSLITLISTIVAATSCILFLIKGRAKRY